MSVVLALLASAIYGAADFLGGLVGRKVPIMAVVLWSQAVGLVMAVLAGLMFRAEALRFSDLVWGATGGLAGTMGLFLLYKGLAEGRMAVVSPVTALVGAIVPMAIGLATGERPVLAGIGFGLFFAAIAQTGEGSGLWPLVGARTAQVSIAAILATIKGLGLPAAGSRLALVVLGAGDILANIFLLLAFRSGLLTIVSVLASLYPVVTVLLAVVILREHIHRRQLVGLTVALLAVALIAA